jgi:hypothetical protein
MRLYRAWPSFHILELAQGEAQGIASVGARSFAVFLVHFLESLRMFIAIEIRRRYGFGRLYKQARRLPSTRAICVSSEKRVATQV